MFVAQDKNFLDTSHVSNKMVSYSLNFIFNFFSFVIGVIKSLNDPIDKGRNLCVNPRAVRSGTAIAPRRYSV